MEFKLCELCGIKFYPPANKNNMQYWKRKKRFCSKSCANKKTSNDRSHHHFDKLEMYQVKRDGCWGWLAAKDNHGYPVLSIQKGGVTKAHRISYHKATGINPDGFEVRHKCDNPECTNPDHLEIGSHHENMADMKNRMRRIEISKDELDWFMSIKINSNKKAPFNGILVDDVAIKLGVSRVTVFNYINRFKK